LRWGLLVTALFAVVFYGADWLTAHRTFRVPVAMRWETSIPFWPWMILVYMTIYPLMWAAPFALRTPRHVRALCWSLAGVIVIAGIGFLLLPAQLEFSASSPSLLFQIADRLNGDYNLVPSLHVALAVTCVTAYSTRAPLLWWAWAAAIAVSTLLTHQHHVLT
jgi:hypothetical protein